MNVVTGLTVYDALGAIKYYKHIFNADVIGDVMMMEDLPTTGSDLYIGKIAHSKVRIGDTLFFLNDQLDNHIQEVGRNIQLCLNVYKEEDMLTIYRKIGKEATLERDIEEEYWGAKSFSFKDPYDIVWHVFWLYNME